MIASRAFEILEMIPKRGFLDLRRYASISLLSIFDGNSIETSRKNVERQNEICSDDPKTFHFSSFVEEQRSKMGPSRKTRKNFQNLAEENTHGREMTFFRHHILSKEFIKPRNYPVGSKENEIENLVNQIFMDNYKLIRNEDELVHYMKLIKNLPMCLVIKLVWTGFLIDVSDMSKILDELRQNCIVRNAQSLQVDEFLGLCYLLMVYSYIDESVSGAIQSYTIDNYDKMSFEDLSLVSYVLFRHERIVK